MELSSYARIRPRKANFATYPATQREALIRLPFFFGLRYTPRMEKPYWLKLAHSALAVKETAGAKHHPMILHWWERIKSSIRDDETAWCAAFVGGILEDSGIPSTLSAAARSYTKWGHPLSGPAVGAVVTFWRGKPDGWSGHVGFVVGKDQSGNLMVLGGNQSDEVNIKPFATNRVLSYRWPKSHELPPVVGFGALPVVDSNGEVSKNES